MNSSPRSSWLFALLCPSLLAFALASSPAFLPAQENEHDDDHDHLHFSHPLVTESPTPDTKVRLDYVLLWTNEDPQLRDHVVRVEGEYAFTHGLSLAVVAPYELRTSPSTARAQGLGDLEVSLKFASVRYGEHGVLLGGGLSAGVPTGSDEKQIGSSHIVELEPFVDAGYKRDRLELVGFARLSSAFNRRAGEEAERDLAFDFSTLYHLHPRLEALMEVTTARSLVGGQAGVPQTFVAPGLKVYPFSNPKLMFGTSLLLGTGAVSSVKAISISAFYHF
ncbi:MAG TPA: hypothetical protein VFP26_04235 [Gemmatimonadaceae bacterium]|jgi:hypothetical protein|nr:hypothetical protein [Gemmatimonadaceae bacterium]